MWSVCRRHVEIPHTCGRARSGDRGEAAPAHEIRPTMTDRRDICERLPATGLNTPGAANRDVAELRNAPFYAQQHQPTLPAARAGAGSILRCAAVLKGNSIARSNSLSPPIKGGSGCSVYAHVHVCCSVYVTLVAGWV